MAEQRDIRPVSEADGLGAVDTPSGYVLAPGKTPQDILARTAALLESEGIDPTWPGFAKGESSTGDSHRA